MKSAVFPIIKREYLERVRSRWFIIATLAGPLLFIGIAVLPVLTMGSSGPSELVVVDRTARLLSTVQPGLEAAGYAVTPVADAAAAGTDPVADHTRRIQDDEIFGILVLDSATLATGRARLTVANALSPIREMALRQVIAQGALVTRLSADAPEVIGLLAGGTLDVEVLDDEVEVEGSDFILAYLGAFLLYMTLLFYAVAVMRSVLEEKTSRIVEVILSSVRPVELMLGKILGVGAVGLTQLGIWAVSFVVLADVGLPRLMEARPELATLREFASVAPTAGQLLLFLAFFLGGYFLYSSLYAAVGAMANSDQEAQQAQAPLVILMIVPAVILPGVLENPESTMAVWTSLVPFFAPVLMFARAVSGWASGAEVAVALAGIAVTTVVVAWIGGRIYRVGILMTGKRPSVRQLWRWVRTG
ncbi:MAG TPA: ABC transporter permease [Longimicrobiales bacterium]|nr:ABC transporter permease [Longimicrobiales bacterium]